ncbi:MAG TPA: alanine--tRNA ligase [Candidatus Methanomethylicus sp.]|jgi:alanyl-tRNA synthetase|nr:alanine--tRNA ligase [Candidatus Methanomethylicus sp.]
MIPAADAYNLQFFSSNGFLRKECKCCKRHFWTLDPDRDVCGDSPCVPFSFIGDPPFRRSYTISEMREAFLSFLERNGHTRVQRYPVVARWRDDIFLTIASIACFQPHVTSGEVPPPHNPLAISQPCIRMNDLDNVGKTGGRHLSIFEMMAHHAFSSKDREIYWKEDTVRLHHDFLTKDLGIDGREITYIEHWWEGGGDAGPDLEGMVRGIELSTLVFMQYRKVGGEYQELPLRIVDTGYGLERFTWVSQGTPTAFEAIYGGLLGDFMGLAGIEMPDERALAATTKYAGLMNIVDAGSLKDARVQVAKMLGTSPQALEAQMLPIENVTALLDHTKTLAFMLSDGAVPSNVQAGYLARLLVRRSKRLIERTGIKLPLSELILMQVDFWKGQFPSLAENVDYVRRVTDLEVSRYERTIGQGKALVSRLIRSGEVSQKGALPQEKLIELYDSNGLPPEIVKEVCEQQGVSVEIPDTFDTIVADRHSASKAAVAPEGVKGILEGLPTLPKTELVYYSQPKARTMAAKVLYADERRIVLDRTIFYPEGGGQPSDTGSISSGSRRAEVAEAQKSMGIVVHFVTGGAQFRPGDAVACSISWDRRMSLARHHSSTHILLGAARKVLGSHVWQQGAQKNVDRSRLDISHFEKITPEQQREIETTANRVVEACKPIKTYFEDRNVAEQRFGFRLYQGGVVHGPTIRVVEVEGWDVEACAGIHCENTGEIGVIKITKSERIQDGVERIEFASGEAALRAIQSTEATLQSVAEILNTPIERIEKASRVVMDDFSDCRKGMDRLRRSMAAELLPVLASTSEQVGGARLIARAFGSLTSSDLVALGSSLVASEPSLVALLASKADGSVVVMAGDAAVKGGFSAGRAMAEVAAVLKGKGGGKPDLGQGRVPLVEMERFAEASSKVRAAMESLNPRG